MTAVAIDGPAGAGKSTVAAEVARVLGFDYVDTGAMYRTVAWAVLDRGINPADEERVSALARELEIRSGHGRVWVGGTDVTELIRTGAVTDVVPIISAYPGVRAALVDRQRAMASVADVVMEGRDIGTTVLPGAPVKVFLIASTEERARRRVRQLGLPEEQHAVASTEAEIRARDHIDANRAASPLARASDAITIDSTARSIGDVVDEIVKLVKERMT